MVISICFVYCVDVLGQCLVQVYFLHCSFLYGKLINNK